MQSATATRPPLEFSEPDTPAELVVPPAAQTPSREPRVQVLSTPAAAAATAASVQSLFTSSEQIGEVLAALASAQGEFAPVLKDSEANIESKRTGVKFSYSYASLAQVLNAVRPALAKNKLALIQAPVAGQNSICVITFVGHESGQWFRNELRLAGAVQDPQELAKIITYLRRISAKAILGVADEDDDGEGETRARANQDRPGQGPVTMPQRAQPTSPQSGASARVHTPASSHAPATAGATPDPAPASFTIEAIEPREKRDKTPYWVVAFSNGVVACTFRKNFFDQLEAARTRGARYVDLVTTKKGDWLFLDSLEPLGGGQ